LAQLNDKKMKSCYIYILSFGMALSGLACGNTATAGVSDLHERVYVQTDKQVYLAGEPVLMKLMTTDDKQIPLVFSKVGYVELVRDSLALLQIKVELTGGTGSGQMLLPTGLPTGYYRLIAYTQWMRNEGPGIFFEKYVAVINTFQSDDRFLKGQPVSDKPVATAKETGTETLSLKPDKATYAVREHGEMIIGDLPATIYTLSLSIAGKDILPVAPATVPEKTDAGMNELYQKYLANMKKANETDEAFEENGVIFYPGMKDKFRAAQSNDPFSKDDGKQTKNNNSFLPEYEGPIITGKIINNETGYSLPTNMEIGKIALYPAVAFPGDTIRFFSGKINATDHRVLFFTSGNPGTNTIATVVYNGGDKYRIDVESPYVNRFEPRKMPELTVDSSCYESLLARSVALQVFRYFSKAPTETSTASPPYLKIKPSSIYRLDDYTRFPSMAEVFTEIITNARFRKNAGKQELSVLIKRGSTYSYGYPLVLLDGAPVSDHDWIYNYDPLLVESITVYTDSYVFGSFLFDGIIELKTYRGFHPDRMLNKSSQILPYESPQKPGPFETPDYSNETNRQSLMPDSRHTLLWNPDIPVEGKTSIRLPFDTSDLTGEFQATVEGITADGKRMVATAVFKVE